MSQLRSQHGDGQNRDSFFMQELAFIIVSQIAEWYSPKLKIKQVTVIYFKNYLLDMR
ncbi:MULTISPECIES: hypothetical protein [Vibrio]|uniref:hypothetical protein n=1 Tax=Vibrio TaxID=662 RepID=UPI002941B32A|nr:MULTISPECIES: hypothetical protein [Vibrio]MDV5034851.1 hypothetical protein [Vibrio diabolicus]MDW1964873.1 hypothetical protein [Vibrio sp. Vb0587]